MLAVPAAGGPFSSSGGTEEWEKTNRDTAGSCGDSLQPHGSGKTQQFRFKPLDARMGLFEPQAVSSRKQNITEITGITGKAWLCLKAQLCFSPHLPIPTEGQKGASSPKETSGPHLA